MEKDSIGFAQYLDSLRVSRNISQQDFVEGICSQRQYQRYIKGESQITSEKISSLIDRLNTSPFTIYKNYFSKKSDMFSQLQEAIRHITEHDYLSANLILNSMNEDDFFVSYHKTIMKYGKTIVDYKLKKLSHSMMISRLKKLVDFPKLLENDYFSVIEINSLLFIGKFEYQINGDATIIEFLYKLLRKEDCFDKSLIKENIPSIYGTLSVILGRLGQNDKALALSRGGIAFCKQHNLYSSLPDLMFFNMIALAKLNRHKEGLLVAKKLFYFLFSLDKHTLIDKYTKHFQALYQLEVKDLFVKEKVNY